MSKVLIAGGAGFLGSKIHALFPEAYALKRYSGEATVCDLTYETDVSDLFYEYEPTVVINAAGKVGGITDNNEFPADYFEENLKIGFNLLHASRIFQVKKFVQIGTVCSYPKYAPIPMKESSFWDGYPEETNSAYGMAKKSLIVQGLAYRKQYDLNVLNPILANLYGPGDNYEESKSHVIPGMISKFLSAIENNEKSVTFFGSGNCTREFLYVEDAAAAIKFLTDTYNEPEIVNVSSGFEVKIKDLAEMLGTLCAFKGDILWDTSKPDGQPRRSFDTSKLSRLGWSAKTSLAVGLFNTVEDYKKICLLNRTVVLGEK